MDLTPFLRIAVRKRFRDLARLDVPRVQEQTLLELVRRAECTRFGRQHEFGRIRSVADFQRQVPVRPFENFWATYWKAAWPILENVTWPGRIPFFAKTSGTTTGRTKYIPVTRELIRANERVGFDLMTYHLHHHPASRPLAGKSFIIGGSTALQEVGPDVWAGDVSGINTKLTPLWVKPHIFPSANVAQLSGWDEKVSVVSRLAVDQRITMLSGMCNWVLVMLDRIRQYRAEGGAVTGPTLPDLHLLIHGGVPMDLYRELYPTSEGFLATADRGPGEGLRVAADNKLFFEFVPLEDVGSERPRRHWLADVERHVDYALVLSNCAGLWAYLLGDVVRFVETQPPRFLIMGRVSQKLSPFGEHLIAAEIEAAVREAADFIGVRVTEYTVGPVLPRSANSVGHHLYLIEPARTLPGDAAHVAELLAERIDRLLIEDNYDYECQRRGDAGVGPPRVRWVAPGTFEAWMRRRGKLGGQHKVPRITPKADRFAELRQELGDTTEHPDEEPLHAPARD
jgi:hypothetical protein